MPWIEKEGRTVDEARAALLHELGVPEDEADIEVVREGAKGLFGLGGEPAVVRARPKREARDVRDAFHDRPPARDDTDRIVEQPPPPPAPAGEPARGGPVSRPAGRSSRAVERADAGSRGRDGDDDDPDSAQEAYEAGLAPQDDEDFDGGSTMSVSERQEITTQVASEMVSGILQRMGLQGEVTSRVAGGTVYVEVFGDDMGILIGRGGKTLEALQELVRAGVQRRLKARAAVVVDVEAYWERRRDGARRSGGRREGSRGGR